MMRPSSLDIMIKVYGDYSEMSPMDKVQRLRFFEMLRKYEHDLEFDDSDEKFFERVKHLIDNNRYDIHTYYSKLIRERYHEQKKISEDESHARGTGSDRLSSV